MKFVLAYNTRRKIYVDDWNYTKIRYMNCSNSGRQILISINGKTTSLARWLKGIKDPKRLVDHWDGDHRNNLESNLRVCSHAENARNRKPNKFKNNNSKYLGTSYCETIQSFKKWRASIRINGVIVCLGYFATEEEAARCYDAAAKKYHGEFARLNFPECQQSSVTPISAA